MVPRMQAERVGFGNPPRYVSIFLAASQRFSQYEKGRLCAAFVEKLQKVFRKGTAQ